MKYIDYSEYCNLCDKLVEIIRKRGYKYVYGVPRGGCMVAQYIAQKLPDIELVDNIIEFSKEHISLDHDGLAIVDDLIDSGRTQAKFSKFGFDFLALIDKRKLKEKEWIVFWYEELEKDATDIVVRQLEFIGENPKRAGLLETPERVVKMWKEIFRGYDLANKPKLTTFRNGDDGVEYDELIADFGTFSSWCEHHMCLFSGNYYFAYIPDKKLIGLSKIARLIDFHSARLQVQERLVKNVLDDLERELEPKGIALIMKGEHTCKSLRGARKKGNMITSDLRGCFKSNPSCRMEFLQLTKMMTNE